MEVYGLHRLVCGLLGGKARPFMTSSPARLLGLFQVSERLLQPIRRAIGHVRPLLTGYYTLSSLLLPPWALPRPWTVIAGICKTLRRLGVVGEGNYQPFDAGGEGGGRAELR